MTPRKLADQLGQVKPARVEALALLLKLTSGETPPEEFAGDTARIEAAIEALMTHARQAQGIIAEVIACRSKPASQTPTGF
jgi:Asp/Glu/hydantoin racemase